MSGYDELSDLKEQQAEISQQRREIEADAFSVMRDRPTYFALKLLLGFGHSAEPPPEPEERVIHSDPQLAPAT